MTILPIADRELRVLSRQRSTYWMRFTVVLVTLIIFFVILAGASNFMRPAQLANELFSTLSWIILVFCAFSGPFVTADCLSEEKREGTLGLLFLTDLRGYDVVIGKLAVSSLRLLYGVLGIFPILALPLLMGGVSAGEFWRSLLVLLVTLFFSLGTGLCVSAVTRESRQAMGMTLAIIIWLGGVLPVAYGLHTALARSAYESHLLLWSSPGYALYRSGDAFYTWKGGWTEYFGSLLTFGGFGAAMLLLAILLLPRMWQDSGRSTRRAGIGNLMLVWRFGTRFGRDTRRRAAFLWNPYFWLASRDRLPRHGMFLCAGLGLALWCAAVFGMYQAGGSMSQTSFCFSMTMFTTFGTSQIFKAMVAHEATRRFNEDRRSGALELLLVTPLNESQMLAGQRRALSVLFFWPMLIIAGMFAGNFWLFYFAGPLHSGNFSMGSDAGMGVMLAGSILCLLLDCLALCWLGMWLGLKSVRHNGAIYGSLLRIMVFPWLVFFMLSFAGVFRSSNGPAALFTCWYLFCAISDVFWILWGRGGLTRQFREIVSAGHV